MSEGDWLIGYGCATTCYPTQMAPAAARVRLQRDGRTRVEIAGHEIGNGAYTVIAQAAAESSVYPSKRSPSSSATATCRPHRWPVVPIPPRAHVPP